MKVTLYTPVSSQLLASRGHVLHLLEVWEYPVPVPLVVAFCGVIDLVPRLEIISGRTVEEHAVYSAATTHNLAGKDEANPVVHLWVRQRAEGPGGGAICWCIPGACGRVKSPRGVFYLTIFDDENSFCDDVRLTVKE